MGSPHDPPFPRPTGAGSALQAPAVAPIVCIECCRPWLDDSERWRMKVTDDELPEAVPYCPGCAAREFGPA
jgi:hypothetical protein